MSSSELPDQAVRDRVTHHPGNVFIQAGAGTGKTYTLVERILERVAPQSDGVEPLDITRIAAITFTRRAAGELKTRLRTRTLEKLHEAIEAENQPRRQRLQTVLEGLDRAFVGTIHSFADRLLSQRPVEGELSPNYQVVEDPESLIEETYDRLIAGVRRGSLEDEFEDSPDDLDGVERTVRTVLESDIPEEDVGEGYRVKAGFESLVESWIQSRDREEPTLEAELDRSAIRASIREVLAVLQPLEYDDSLPGVQFLKAVVEPELETALELDDPRELFVHLTRLFQRAPLNGRYGNMQAGDFGVDRAKGVQSSLAGNPLKTNEFAVQDPSYHDSIIEPLRRWMAARLIPVRRAAIELYDQVKQERGVLDQTDLLINLRDVLRNKKQVRREMKQKFDHILVDEFQDTDPLQCEIIFFLAETLDGKGADRWNQVNLHPDKLTVVGDPKQSIYRFRRADVEIYARAIYELKDQGAASGTLTTNFRSQTELIDAFNACFSEFLGEPGEDREFPYDPATGEALYETVNVNPDIDADGQSGDVTILRYDAMGTRKAEGMHREADMIASYVEWLTDGEPVPEKLVRDPESDLGDPRMRPVRKSDVAILGPSTTYFDAYLRAFAERGIPCSVAGGSTFLDDDMVKQFILALRSVADPRDGVATAAVKRPPLFNLDYGDLLYAGLDDREYDVPADRAQRADDVEEFLWALRRKRLNRSPLETGLDLLQQSGLERYWAARPNGQLKLTSLYHVLARMDTLAREQGLNYDQVTHRMREWVTEGGDINGPAPLSHDAVRLWTTYQAKGLEFPVVILHDGRSGLSSGKPGVYRQSPGGDRFFINLSGLKVDVQGGHERSLKDFEREMTKAESKRLYYVAATRARDRLVMPSAYNQSQGSSLYDEIFHPAEQQDLLNVLDVGEPGTYPWDSTGSTPSTSVTYSEERTADRDRRFEELTTALDRSLEASLEFTNPHKRMAERFGESDRDYGRARHGRFFGRVVHRALELIALDEAWGEHPEPYLATARRSEGPAPEGEAELVRDVNNAVRVLREEGLLEASDLHPEFPITHREDGRVINGTIDLVVESGDEIWIIDYKTDDVSEVEDPRETFAPYFYQLSLYEDALTSEVSGEVKSRLIFTQTGELMAG